MPIIALRAVGERGIPCVMARLLVLIPIMVLAARTGTDYDRKVRGAHINIGGTLYLVHKCKKGEKPDRGHTSK